LCGYRRITISSLCSSGRGTRIVNETEKTPGQATAHGLDGSLVEPDWPTLTLTEVRNVLKQIPAAGYPIAILSVSPRPFSAASVVETTKGRIFLKRHAHAVRDAEGLEEEHRFMQCLREGDICVPVVLATVDAKTALETTEWTYEVHEIPAGVDLYQDA